MADTAEIGEGIKNVLDPILGKNEETTVTTKPAASTSSNTIIIIIVILVFITIVSIMLSKSKPIKAS